MNSLATAVGIVVLVAGLAVLAMAKGGDIGEWGSRDLSFPLATARAFAVGNVVRRFGLDTTQATPLQAVALNETAALVALLSLFAVLSLPDGRVAIVDPLSGTAPLFTTVFAYFLLRDVERVTRGIVAGATLVVVGAGIIIAL